MAVKIQWQPPLVPEERKKAQWEKIIRYELGELDDALDVSLRFEAENLRWKVEAQTGAPLGRAQRRSHPRPRRGRAARRRASRSSRALPVAWPSLTPSPGLVRVVSADR